MGYLKIVPDLFLGKQELQRFYDFINDKMNYLIQMNTVTWGLVKDSGGSIGTNFQVLAGTNPKTFKFAYDSYAIDPDVNVIHQKAQDNIPFTPSTDGWYWIKIRHIFTKFEDGTVSIDANGNVTGVGTSFTDVLRSNEFPSRIKFSDGATNSGEYEIVDIIDDENMIISGSSFSPEINLNYAVVGTFTPGSVIADANKFPFQYDSCEIPTPVLESQVDTAPSKSANEFWIARVHLESSLITAIQDKRTEFYVSK